MALHVPTGLRVTPRLPPTRIRLRWTRRQAVAILPCRADPYQVAHAFAYLNGRRDGNTGSEYLVDDGSGGDVLAGDGLYTRAFQASFGTGSVTVSSVGQTSAGGSFTVLDPDAVTLEPKWACVMRIRGVVGSSYRIEWTADLGNPDSWVPLTTITLTTSPEDWADLDSVDQLRGFYRAVRVP